MEKPAYNPEGRYEELLGRALVLRLAARNVFLKKEKKLNIKKKKRKFRGTIYASLRHLYALRGIGTRGNCDLTRMKTSEKLFHWPLEV